VKLFTIFGNPVHHSKSPLIHNAVFSVYKPDSRYTRTLLESGDELKDTFFKLGIEGASVTVPFKEDAFNQCDEVVGIAKKIGAVNCLVNRDGKMIGYNTDVYGFLDSIKDFGETPRVLIIGAGGTAKALLHGFLEKNYDVTVLNRSEKRLESFKKLGVKTATWDSFQSENYDLVVNVTSAGLTDSSFPAPENILKEVFRNSRFAVDVIYHETPFLKLAKESGLTTKDGSLMLVYQGVLANELFTGLDRDLIEKEMLRGFQLS
jgi:shikimate dehydrogenase